MSAFIIRPFGTKHGIDFDRVERELIDPVLTDLGIRGRTTEEIARAGNIRTDMFELLVLADLVIADISIHNANAYYELGVRHALRDRGTVLIRCRADEVPFDLRTDRYVEYARDDPGAAREALLRAVDETLQQREVDSPVYGLLPALTPPDPAALAPVPAGFQEAVRTAQRSGDLAMLGVLGDETRRRTWELAGLRLVGDAQFQLRALRAARSTWERVRGRAPDDARANQRLATIYQKLDDMAESDAAIARLLGAPGLAPGERAEALALSASNWKTRWIAEWRAAPADRRQAVALASPALGEAGGWYLAAFHEDLDAFYPGINALALGRARAELARAAGATWEGLFESPEEAARERDRLDHRCQELAGAVRHAIDAAVEKLKRDGAYDVWVDLTSADYRFLTSTRPAYVASQYASARTRLEAWVQTSGRPVAFPAESAARQIRMFRDLGIFADNASAALEALGVGEAPATGVAPPMRLAVFTGHRVDEPGRRPPRFPNTPECEARARRAIRDVLQAEIDAASGSVTRVHGVAGGANGGDTLFHEVCAELGIDTTLLLALPADEFVRHSVQSGGPAWVERFRRLCASHAPRVLSRGEALPDWLAGSGEYSIWARNNLWTLHTALAHEGAEVSLIALWNGRAGDGPGGTRDMLALAEQRGVRIVRIDTNELFRDHLDGDADDA